METQVAVQSVGEAEKQATEGAKCLVSAISTRMSAAYADDPSSRRADQARADQLERMAYQKLGQVDLDMASRIVNEQQSKLGYDEQLQRMVRLDVKKHTQARAAAVV